MLVLPLLLILLVGCVPREEKQLFQQAVPAVNYLAKAANGAPFSFYPGPYQGGTAVLGGNDEAFWVKDGKPYVVNDKAKKIAPDLEQAPSNIQYNEEFRAAAKAKS